MINIRPSFFIGASLLLLALPLPWISAIALCCLIHELGHLAAMRLTGVSVKGLTLGMGGAILETEGMTPLQELLSAAAGPLTPLLFLFFARHIPRTALCALIQGIYHCLPLRPLDGSSAIHGFLAYMGWDQRISVILEWLILSFLLFLGAYLTINTVCFILPILCFTVILRVIAEKLLANRLRTEYNRCTNS